MVMLSCAAARAATSAAPMPTCLPANLEVWALPPASSSPKPDGHLLVVEIQNTGAETCHLEDGEAVLEPPLNSPVEKYDLSSATPQGEVTLAPGRWAHVLVAWLSQRYLGSSCRQYWGLRITLHGFDSQRAEQSSIVELRNLPMRACAGPVVSNFRPGPYTTGAKFPQVNPAFVSSKDWEIVPDQLPWQEVGSSALYQASIPFPWVLLGAEHALRIVSPVEADHGCDFRVMRKREPNGDTILAFQDCAEPGVKGFSTFIYPDGVLHSEEDLLVDGMMPQHTGVVDYDFIGNLGSEGVAEVGTDAGASGRARSEATGAGGDPGAVAGVPVVAAAHHGAAAGGGDRRAWMCGRMTRKTSRRRRARWRACRAWMWRRRSGPVPTVRTRCSRFARMGVSI
jgi:hypothetical protein